MRSRDTEMGLKISADIRKSAALAAGGRACMCVCRQAVLRTVQHQYMGHIDFPHFATIIGVLVSSVYQNSVRRSCKEWRASTQAAGGMQNTTRSRRVRHPRTPRPLANAATACGAEMREQKNVLPTKHRTQAYVIDEHCGVRACVRARARACVVRGGGRTRPLGSLASSVSSPSLPSPPAAWPARQRETSVVWLQSVDQKCAEPHGSCALDMMAGLSDGADHTGVGTWRGHLAHEVLGAGGLALAEGHRGLGQHLLQPVVQLLHRLHRPLRLPKGLKG